MVELARDQVAERLGQQLSLDDLLRLQLGEALVDLTLDGRLRLRVSGDAQERPHRLDRFITGSRSDARVLGFVLDPAVQLQVLSDVVVHEAGDVLDEVRFGLSAARLHALTGLEGLEHHRVDELLLSVRPLTGLRNRTVELAVVAEHRDDRLDNRFVLSHCVCPLVQLVRRSHQLEYHSKTYDALYVSIWVRITSG